MKHKGLIILSTVLVFILALTLAFVWLFRVRYVEIDVLSASEEETLAYDEINSIVERECKGKSYFSIDVNRLIAKLTSDPYVSVKSVEKVFPDKIKVKVAKRRERFAFLCGDEYFITDSEYHLLKKSNDLSQIGDTIIKIELNGVEMSVESLALGSKIGYENDNLVGAMTQIFNGFTDGLNMISKVTVMGTQNWIRFNSKTGVCIEFRFTTASGVGMSTPEEMQSIIETVSEVEEKYFSLTESQQRVGNLLVLTKATGEISIEYSSESEEV